MRRFWRRDNGLAELERELRARRSEPSSHFVRSLARRVGSGSGSGWFEPKARYTLAGLVTAAVLAAGASAGGLGLARTSAHDAIGVVHHLTAPLRAEHGSSNNNGNDNKNNNNNGNDNKHKNNGNNNGNGNDNNGNDHHPPEPPGHHQYAGQCGLPPRVQCTVQVDPHHPEVKEGNSGLTPVTFTLELKGRNNDSDGTVFIHYQTVDGTAIANQDYQPASGTIQFPFGASRETVTVYIIGDTTPEPNETFSVDWTSQNSSAVMGNNDGSTTITIKNDDKPPHGHGH